MVPKSNDPNLPETQNNTNFPLKVPKGFAISIFAKDLPGARAMAIDRYGNMWVSQTSEGIITQLQIENGQVISQNAAFKNLVRPHGLAIDDITLFFAEENKITRLDLYSDDQGRKIIDLPKGGRHFTRTLHFGSDGRLYVSIGSSCDVCYEKDERLASIYSMNKDRTDFKKVASGLRNSVFMATNPVDGKIWATEMGRDHLGDDLPPDEINEVQEGRNYGWPYCYGFQIRDITFEPNKTVRCYHLEDPVIGLPAHSAPLGLAFIPEEGWPEDYWHDLVVAFHGSWNRTQPTGYKLSRIKLDAQGNYEGTDSTGSPQVEDFISGWLAKDGETALGRPVDVLPGPGGVMYVSDDKAGVVYKIQYLGDAASTSNNVIIDSPKENSVISSPLKITGKAKGSWFFEASFPVQVLDENGKVLGESYAQAQGDWMTADFVPFESLINFSKPSTDTGLLVFKKDNPSGLPENDSEYLLPVKF